MLKVRDVLNAELCSSADVELCVSVVHTGAVDLAVTSKEAEHVVFVEVPARFVVVNPFEKELVVEGGFISFLEDAWFFKISELVSVWRLGIVHVVCCKSLIRPGRKELEDSRDVRDEEEGERYTEDDVIPLLQCIYTLLQRLYLIPLEIFKSFLRRGYVLLY